MNPASPIFLSTVLSLALGVIRFFSTRKARGKLLPGFWTACGIFFAGTIIRNSIQRRTAGIDPFAVLGLEPTKAGIAKLTKLALRRYPDDEVLLDTINQIKEFSPSTVEYLWPFVNALMLRCPYAEATAFDGICILGPIFFLRLLSYIGQILVASIVCPSIGSIKTPLSMIAVVMHTCEIIMVISPSNEKKTLHQLLLGTDFCLGVLLTAYIALEMKILAPNRVDPVTILRSVRSRLDAANNTQAACKNVTEEICSSEELLLLYGGWMRSVDSQPPPKSAQGPFSRVRKSEDPPTFALKYLG